MGGRRVTRSTERWAARRRAQHGNLYGEATARTQSFILVPLIRDALRRLEWVAELPGEGATENSNRAALTTAIQAAAASIARRTGAAFDVTYDGLVESLAEGLDGMEYLTARVPEMSQSGYIDTYTQNECVRENPMYNLGAAVVQEKLGELLPHLKGLMQ